MLTRKQHELLSFIQTRLDASGISSFEEMRRRSTSSRNQASTA
jgi:SOS-response transcriptional repressor LexA